MGFKQDWFIATWLDCLFATAHTHEHPHIHSDTHTIYIQTCMNSETSLEMHK